MSDNINRNVVIPTLPLNKTYKRLYPASIDPTFEHATYQSMQDYLKNKTAYFGQLLYCKENDKHYRIANNSGKMELKEVGASMIASNVSYSNSNLSNITNVRTALDSVVDTAKKNTTDIEIVSNQVVTVNSYVANINTSIGTLNNNVNAVSTNMNTVKSDINTAKSDINKVKTDATGMRSQILEIEKLLLKQFPVSYVAPKLSLSSSNGVKFEKGSQIQTTLIPNFTKNDAGTLTKYTLLRNGSVIKDLPVTENFNEQITLNDNTRYTAQVKYNAGDIKLNSLGKPHQEGQIQAGSKEDSIMLLAVRGSWGCSFTSADKPTAEAIRAVKVTSLDLQNGSTIKVVAGANDRTIVFAYPNDLRECSKIRYEEFNDDNNKTVFKQTTLSIPDKSGANHIDYKVYYYTAPVPFGTKATFTLTI